MYCERTLEYPEKTHTNTGKICKLHIEITREDSGFKPTTFLLITEKQKKVLKKKQQDFLLWTVTVKVDVKLIWLQFVAELRNCELWKCHASTLMYVTRPQKLAGNNKTNQKHQISTNPYVLFRPVTDTKIKLRMASLNILKLKMVSF